MADELGPEIQERTRRLREILPGYPGLALPEDRRAADETLRRRVTATVENLLHHLESVETSLGRQGPRPEAARAAHVRQVAETMADKTQLASYAFSPFFVSVRIPEDRIAEALAGDTAILDALDPLARALEETLNPEDDLGALLGRIERILSRLDGRLEDRINVIMAMH